MKNVVKIVFLSAVLAISTLVDAGGLLSRGSGVNKVNPKDVSPKKSPRKNVVDPEVGRIPATFDLTAGAAAHGDMRARAGSSTSDTDSPRAGGVRVYDADQLSGKGSRVFRKSQLDRVAKFKRLKARGVDALKQARQADDLGDAVDAARWRKHARVYLTARGRMIPADAGVDALRAQEANLKQKNEQLAEEIGEHQRQAALYAGSNMKREGVRELKSKKIKEEQVKHNKALLANLKKERAALEETLVMNGAAE